MQKCLLLFSFTFLFVNLQADIHHIDYGGELMIGMNENYPMDINEDGQVDFYINGYENEVGFVPIGLVGCFTSPNGSAMNNIGSREMQIHEEGDMIKIESGNMFDYIDFDRGSLLNPELGLADGWTDMEPQYIGFAVFVPSGKVINGWAKVAVDETNETLIVFEIGYEDPVLEGDGGILAGDTGSSTVGVNAVNALEDILIAPNPANDWVRLAFDYNGVQNLGIKIQDFSGKVVYESKQRYAGKTTLNISVADWTKGMYVIRFETNEGIKGQKLSIH